MNIDLQTGEKKAEAIPVIRVALIGYGLGGATFHAPLIACTSGMRLDAIVTGNAQRRAQAASEHPQARLLASAEDVWRSADAYDLVVVTSTNETHVPLAMQALAAGLHVIVDKPFARTAAEARNVIDAAKRHGRFLSVYQNRRWDSDFLTLKRLLAEGRLGHIFRFESRLERWRPVARGGWRESSVPEHMGGLLYDLGSHLIDQALQLFGPVTHVYAELDCRRSGLAVDDDVFVALTHTNGTRSHLRASVVTGAPLARMQVLGSNGTYLKTHPDLQEDALRAGKRPDHAGWGMEPPEYWGTFGAGAEVSPVRSEAGAYQQYYAAVVAALRNGTPPPVDPQDAVLGLEIIAAAQRSAAEKQLVLV